MIDLLDEDTYEIISKKELKALRELEDAARQYFDNHFVLRLTEEEKELKNSLDKLDEARRV